MRTVSVIIPVYNAEKCLERCINSVLLQNYKNIEIIIIDDGSIDNSKYLCDKYAINKSIKVIHKENGGPASARNVGIKYSTGDLICFVDSDDFVDNDYIAKLLNAIECNPKSLVMCGYIKDDLKFNNCLDECIYNSSYYKELDYNNHLLELYDKTLIQQLWNKIFIRSIIVDNDITFDESLSIGEDTRFVLEYLKYLKPNQIYFINECLYHYKRDQENSLMFNTGYEKIDNLLDNLKSLLDLTSLTNEVKQEMFQSRRNTMIENYAYIIYHNPKMKEKTKKELILRLDEEKGHELYKKNRILYLKEKVSKLLNRR